MAVFTKTIADLEQVADEQSRKAAALQEQRAKALAEEQAANQEATRALLLVSKLNKLVGA